MGKFSVTPNLRQESEVKRRHHQAGYRCRKSFLTGAHCEQGALQAVAQHEDTESK